MNVLVIGYGSAGSRHARILAKLGHHVLVVSKRRSLPYYTYTTSAEAFSKNRFEYIVIANKTVEHFSTFQEVINRGYRGTVLIEKPLFEKPYEKP